MSIRLQILLDEDELQEVKKLAIEEKLTVSAWVRRAIQHEKKERPGTAARKKLQIINKSSKYNYPTGDYQDIAAEIDSGYSKEPLT